MAVRQGGLTGKYARRGSPAEAQDNEVTEEEEVRMKIYLSYGSNLNMEQMANRCPTANVVGTATLRGYRLLFRGGHDCAVATVEPMKDSSVPVLLWEISPADEAALDRYEGWPFLYRKESLEVQLDGKPVTAMAYIMNEGAPLGVPGCYYYNVILQGYKAHGFDVEVLRKAVRDSSEGEDDGQDC